MQQTEKYQLNLMEEGDEFSVAPINENTRRLEEALAAQKETEDARFKTQLRFKLGSYKGTGEYGKSSSNRLEFDFKPLILVVVEEDYVECGGSPWVRGASAGWVRNLPDCDRQMVFLTWEDRAVQWYQSSQTAQLNVKDFTYYYFAAGTDE